MHCAILALVQVQLRMTPKVTVLSTSCPEKQQIYEDNDACKLLVDFIKCDVMDTALLWGKLPESSSPGAPVYFMHPVKIL
ncbi:hypothetical protein [Chitinophaga polysaccharea]|uniref:hypothetical protein n=1 Tax=Chitinophaga polysaccharea TaxID=1293035 RepID=UPI0011576626|nr:hypothetical protein [Chitinophaga polysaccharea]